MIKLITYDMLEYYVYIYILYISIYIYPSALNLSTNGVKPFMPASWVIMGAAWHDWDFSMAMLNYWWGIVFLKIAKDHIIGTPSIFFYQFSLDFEVL